MARVALDSGVLIALERGSVHAWAWLRRAAERGEEPLVNVAAVAEVWRRPPSASIMRALAGCEVEPVDAPLARAAGEAIGAIGAGLGDALIAASAARRGMMLVSTDIGDMHALAQHFRGLVVRGL
ncbi:MAG: PIN domain-containing protein [Solirubrobacteraceae bacterium]